MTRQLFWVFATALGFMPAVALAQPQQPPAAATAVADPSCANENEVTWLRQRVEQLEAQVASTGNGHAAAVKGPARGANDSSMPPGAMGDDKMGSMPMDGAPMKKMKTRHHRKMGSGTTGTMGNSGGSQSDAPQAAPQAPMGDM